MIHTYSLADYQLTIGLSETVSSLLGLRDANGNLLTNFSIGGPGENGEGSFVGEIRAARETNLYETTGDATGGWVHDKNLDKTGTITLEINQISDDVITLVQLCQIFESIQTNTPGLNLTISSTANTPSASVVTGRDAYIQKLPELAFEAKAQNLEWVFTCGQIIYDYSR